MTQLDKNGLGKSLPNYIIFLGKLIFLVENKRLGVVPWQSPKYLNLNLYILCFTWNWNRNDLNLNLFCSILRKFCSIMIDPDKKIKEIWVNRSKLKFKEIWVYLKNYFCLKKKNGFGSGTNFFWKFFGIVILLLSWHDFKSIKLIWSKLKKLVMAILNL